MKSIKVCEYSRSRSFHHDLILQDQASGERSQDQWSSGVENKNQSEFHLRLNHFGFKPGLHKLVCTVTEADLKFENKGAYQLCSRCTTDLRLWLRISRWFFSCKDIFTYEPVHEKANNLGFRPGPTQNRLYSHRSRTDTYSYIIKGLLH